ncbi:unnamed protein product [Camellia sinensis]
MATVDKSHVDLEDAATTGGAGGSTLSDGGSDDLSSTADASSSLSGAEIVGVSRESSASECSVEVDLEAGVPQVKVHLARSERDCRICHLSLDATNQESNGIPIELGCSCKDDLTAAHRHCDEAWFKIKGNK